MMLALLSGTVIALGALGFDINAVLGAFYPGRETVQIVGSDGDTYSYACKPGPAGETPQAQAEAAHAAFEENLQSFASAFASQAMSDFDDGTPALSTALTLNRNVEAWARAARVELERKFGCVHLG
jgi:hypothetical protein